MKQYVYFYDPTVQILAEARKLARWIGVAHAEDVGNPMIFWVVLPRSFCKVLARLTVSSLTDDELGDPAARSPPNAEVDPVLAALLPATCSGRSVLGRRHGMIQTIRGRCCYAGRKLTTTLRKLMIST
jgi:hypothetical protein